MANKSDIMPINELIELTSKPSIIAITMNIIPFLASPATIWPNPGIIKDSIAASIAFTIFYLLFGVVYNIIGLYLNISKNLLN